MAELQFHPTAAIFPLMEGFEYDRLVLDIKNHGLKEEIWTYDGQIIDGRNRYRACKQAKVKPTFKEWDGEGSLVEFVFSLNFHRRHLNTSQSAMIGAGLAKNLEDEAAERQRAGKKPDPAANLQSGTVASIAAAATGVSERSVASAIKVTEQCDESVVAAVTSGEVSVSDAAKVAELPKPKQRRALRRVKKGESKTLASAAKEESKDESEPLKPICDGKKNPVPANLHETFQTRQQFTNIVSELTEIQNRLEEIAQGPAGTFLSERWLQLKADLVNAKQAVKFSAPYQVCPYCKGKGCKKKAGEKSPCRETGWTVKGITGTGE